MRWMFVVLAVLMLLVPIDARAQSIPSPPSAKPNAADEATAKKNFESGLKLYGEGSFAEALIAFEQSYRIGGRPSALKNIAQCHRNLKHFVEAYEAQEQLLALHDAQLPVADKKAVQQALDELGVLTGTILVTVSVPDADILIDGKAVARSPMPKPKRVSVATHTVRVTKPAFESSDQEVAVGSQENKTANVKLEPEKTTGHVVVREQNGRDVHVFIDGEDKGGSPWEGDVIAGEHTVEAKSTRFASDARRIKVTSKERIDVALDAAPLTGHLRVTTIPASANITVDGKLLGSGAWEGDLPEGTHRIEVGFADQPPQVREVTLARGQLVVQEIPVVAAIAGTAPPDYRGLYVRFALAGMLGLAGQPNDEQPAQTKQTGSFMGAGTAALKVGHAWDWYGAEGVAMFMFEHRDQEYEYASSSSSGTGPSHFTDEANGANAFFGAGGRVTSKNDSIRFTFGLAPGIAIRSFGPRRFQEGGCNGGNCGSSPTPDGGGNRFVQGGTNSPITTTTGSTDRSFASAGYTAFALVMDGGILLGSTPGTKFFLGVQAWLDFPPATIVTGPDTVVPLASSAYKQPGRGITLIDGPQFYFGPSLGLQFGH